MPSPTSWTLYASNELAWQSMIADCEKATTSIVLEQFIFYPDEFGQRLIDVCTERAAAGVKVRFLWDAIGSFSLTGAATVEDLRKKGIELLFWKTLVPAYYHVHNYRAWYLRNHRRTLVIDGKVGYTGSICIRDILKNWRDTNVRVEGAVVTSMQFAFDQMWRSAKRSGGAFRAALKQKKLPAQLPRDPEFSYVTNSPAAGKRHLHRTYVAAIRNAQKYIFITTPYFVPTHRMIRVLKMAAHRGVDVRILVPESSNIYAADQGARSFFDTLLASGVRIFLYPETLIHSKTMVVDGNWATVGSLNLDAASLLYNYEANLVSTNSDFSKELTGHFMRDVEVAKEVTIEDRQNMLFIEKIPEYLIRLVRKFL